MKEKFKNIELLRFIFAVLIVMFHFRNCTAIKPVIAHALPGLCHCNVCVDFFFIIAGFFLFYLINTTQSTFEFAKKRFFRLAPMVWIFLIIISILSIFFDFIHFSVVTNIPRIFLLSNIGFAPAPSSIAGVIHWFIPVLFWVTLFYFYITKIIDKKYLNLVMWLITIISLGLSLNYHNFNTGGNTTNICYFINTGILRGLYGMGIGYFISKAYKSGFLQKCSTITKYIISFVEIYCIGFLAHYMLSVKDLPAKSGFLYLVIFSILFYLFLVKKGFVSKLFENNLSQKLGAYSYSIYVTHPIIDIFFKKLIFIQSNTNAMNHIKLFYSLEVILAVVLGIIIHYLCEKPVNKLISRKLAKNKVL